MSTSSRLCFVTRHLLATRPASMKLTKIADDLNIPYAWLGAFIRGDSDDPGVERCELLYEYLTGTKLNIVSVKLKLPHNAQTANRA